MNASHKNPVGPHSALSSQSMSSPEQQAKELWAERVDKLYPPQAGKHWVRTLTEAKKKSFLQGREETLLALEKEIKDHIRCIEGTDSQLDRGALLAYELMLSKLKTVPPIDKQ